jgi:hypothetical protein
MSVSLYRLGAENHFINLFFPLCQLLVGSFDIRQNFLPPISETPLYLFGNFGKPDLGEIGIIHAVFHSAYTVITDAISPDKLTATLFEFKFQGHNTLA